MSSSLLLPEEKTIHTAKDGRWQEGIVACSLNHLFEPPSASFVSVERYRRAFVATHTIRFAAETVGIINKLANMLLTLYFIDLTHSNSQVPLLLCNPNYTIYNWSIMIVTTMNGEFRYPSLNDPDSIARKVQEKKIPEATDEKQALTSGQQRKRLNSSVTKQRQEEKKDKSEKKQKTPKETDEKAKEEEDIRRRSQSDEIKRIEALEKLHSTKQAIFHHMLRVFNEQMKPLMGPEMQWPDRAGLSEALKHECRKRLTTFKTMYGETFLARQRKVVRYQVQNLPSFQELVIPDDKRLSMRYSCTTFITASVNRNRPSMDQLRTAWEKCSGGTTNIPAPFMEDIQRLVAQHRDGFGNSPLSLDFYRLTAADASSNASCYVHYFGYLRARYQELQMIQNLRVDESAGKKQPKWKPFAIIPQCGLKVPFITVNATTISELSVFTKRIDCRDNILAQLHTFEYNESGRVRIPVGQLMSAVRRNCKIDWLKRRLLPHSPQYENIIKAWADDNSVETFDALFSCSKDGNRCRYRRLLHKDVGGKSSKTRTKYSARCFTSLVTTDGQQAHVHYKGCSRRDNSFSIDNSTPSSKEPPAIPKREWEKWKDPSNPFRVAAVDPGHHYIMTAVINYPPSVPAYDPPLLTSDTVRPATRKGKQKFARVLRRTEANQKVYALSNKRWYNITGRTAANETRDRWRKRCGLKALDLELAKRHEDCNMRSWSTAVYGEYVKFLGQHWTMIWQEMTQRKYSKLRFRVYQQTQRAYGIVVNELTENSPQNFVAGWGNGSFGPTSSGHAAAPNKRLRKELGARGVDIRLVPEYNTSKYTPTGDKSVYSVQRQFRSLKKYHQAQERQLAKIGTEGPLSYRKHELRGLLYWKSNHLPLPSSLNPLLQGAPAPVYHHHLHGTSTVVGRAKSRPFSRDVMSGCDIIHIMHARTYGGLSVCFRGAVDDDEDDDTDGV